MRWGRLVRTAVVLVLGAWLAGGCGSAFGQSGGGNPRFAGGIGVHVDAQWVDGAGYRPVVVTITPVAPTTADKTFTIELLTASQYSARQPLRAARDIELPAGSGPVQATLSLPQTPDDRLYEINVFEDGRLQPKLSTSGQLTGNVNQQNDWGESIPAVLVVGNTMPDSSPLAAEIGVQDNGAQYQYNTYGVATAVTPTAPGTPLNLPNLVTRSVPDLPQQWIDYSSLDVVCLSLGQLEEVAEKNPAALEAMRRWTAAGGNLWVYGVGPQWQGIGRLEELLGMRPASAEAEDSIPAGWDRPDEEDYTRPVPAGLVSPDGQVYPYYDDVPEYGNWDPYQQNVTPSPDEPPAPAPEEKPPATPHFLYREHELGMVVALAAEDPFPGTQAEWRGVLNAMGANRWLWHLRHGMSMVRENADYWEFPIPGVGLVPVTEFCLLITVFVLAIGPVNYWLLRRAKRLHLLVVTIPLGAAVVTLALFAYALVSDGLGTRVRARSVTLLDQRRGEAVCWTRLSYYAGLAPRDGLTFSGDVAVLPLEDRPMPNYNDAPRRRELIWNQKGDEQWLASGWLKSRTPMQLLTVRSRATDIGLELLGPAAGADRPRIRNGLGVRVLQLLVCADDGKPYWAEDVDAGQTVALAEFTPAAREGLLGAHLDNEPALPDGGQGGYASYGSLFGSRYYGGYYYGSGNLAAPTQRTGRLESVLHGEIGTLLGGNLALLRPGSYLAVVATSPEVELGVDAAREESGYHVILGRW